MQYLYLRSIQSWDIHQQYKLTNNGVIEGGDMTADKAASTVSQMAKRAAS